MQRFNYTAYNLELCSEVECPGLQPVHLVQPDITIQYGDVKKLFNEKINYWCHQVATNHIIFNFANIAYMSVNNGAEVIIDRAPQADDDIIHDLLLTAGLSTILYQRGMLLLHASAIVVNNAAVAFVGHSGAGKSTLAAAFHKRNYQIIADDISAVSMSNKNNPILHSGYPQLKLHQDSLTYFGEDSKNLNKVSNKEMKFKLPVRHQFCHSPVPLKCIYVLTPVESSIIKLELLNSFQKFTTLMDNIFHKELIQGFGYDTLHFRHGTQIANNIVMKKVYRPQNGFFLDELTDLLEKDILGHEVINGKPFSH